MKKMIFVCTGNTIMFILAGLAFAFPFSEVNQTENIRLSATLSLFPLLLIAYIIVYPICFYILKKAYGWNKGSSSELSFSDEREKDLSAQAAKKSYTVLMGGIISVIAILGGVQFFCLFTHQINNIYPIAIILLSAVLILSTITYGVKWCLEYRK